MMLRRKSDFSGASACQPRPLRFVFPILSVCQQHGPFMRYPFLLLAALLATGLPAVAAAPVPAEISLGEGHLKATVLRPAGPGPFPAVIGMHGCAGLHNRSGRLASVYRDWGQRLVAAGLAVVFPDSYGSRGLGNQCRVRARAIRTSRERVADIDAARVWLQAQTWVVRDRISLLGWSSGGTSVLWAVRPSLTRDKSGDFRSAVAIYPGCIRLNTTAWSGRVPTLVLIGGADEVSSPAVCQQMVAGARGRSARSTIHIYPGAYHDFDYPARAVQIRNGYAFSVDGTGRIHSGTNTAARADALKRVPEWLLR